VVSPVLQLAGVRLRRAGQDFGPFDLQVAGGEHLALLGPSGAGKSTLLRLMGGDLAPSHGRVLLAGQDLCGLSPLQRARHRAVLPQSHQVAFGLAVELVVGLGRWRQGNVSTNDPTVRAALQWAQAEHLRGRRYDQLSGGEQARVQLARVMAQLADVEDGLLLVDEPLSALDPGLQLELWETLGTYARQRGHALVAVLHDLQHGLNHFDCLALLRDGAVVAETPATLAALPALGQLYDLHLQGLTLPDGSHVVAARRAA
jgi:iron complex transport system ATP-binding protein